MSKQYEYHPLSSRCIRLMSIEPGPFQSPLSVRLGATNLDSANAFTALSWTWGKTRSEVLHIEGDATLLISQNLERALRCLRQETEIFVVWVDQICINQDDTTERDVQVPMMLDIYSKAKMTIGWISDIEACQDRNGLEKAVSRLEEIGLACQKAGLATLSWQEYSRLFDDDVTSAYSANCQIMNHKRKLCDMIQRFEGLPTRSESRQIEWLCDLPYFRRGWILQEITIPTNLKFHIGHICINGDVFCAAILLIYVLVHHRGRDPIYSLDKWVHPKVAIRKQYDRDPTAKFFGLASILKKNATSIFGPGYDSPIDNAEKKEKWECGMKDRIFGVLGLCNDKADLQTKISYKMSWEAIYSSATKHIIQTPDPEETWYGGMNVLSQCASKRPDRVLPTWTPDFSGLGSSKTFADQTRNFLQAPFNASQGELHSITNEEQNGAGPDMLICGGILLDQVKRIGSKSNYGIDGEQSINAFFKSLRSLVSESKEIISSPTGSIHPFRQDLRRVDQTIWRLPVLNCEVHQGATSHRRCTSFSYQGFVDTFVLKTKSSAHERYVDALIMSKDKVPFLGAKGFVGISQPNVKEGDVICVLYGSAFPLLLRRQSHEPELYTLVGEAFVDGIMDGEALGIGFPSRKFKLK